MKKSILVLVGIITLLFCSEKSNAQDQKYYVGKWDILTTGTPSGDSHGTLILEQKDGKLVGTFQPQDQQPAKLNRVEIEDDEITVYFTSTSGYDVYLYLEKIDENNVEGSMMDMFDSTGERIIEEKKEEKKE